MFTVAPAECVCVCVCPSSPVTSWNAELTRCVPPSGADSCEMFGKKKERKKKAPTKKKKTKAQKRAASDDPREKKAKQYVSNAYVSVHFELNHTSPYAPLHRLRTENLLGGGGRSLLSHHVRPSRGPPLRLRSSPLSLVGDSSSHCGSASIWKRPFKRCVSPLIKLR